MLTFILAACETAAPAAPGPVGTPGDPASPGATVSPPTAPTPPPPLAVAFVQDLSPEGSADRLLPVARAVELAFAAAALDPDEPLAVEVVPLDTQGDPDVAAAIAAEIAGDASYVAAIAAPDLPGQAGLVAELAEAGVPLLSLSGRGAVADAPPGAWLRLVAPVRTQATVLADTVAGLRRAQEGVCVMDAPSDGTVLARAALRSLTGAVRMVEADGVQDVMEAGCGVVLWPGDLLGGAELGTALAAIEPHPPVLAGGPALRDPRFPDLAEGTRSVAVCSCADRSTSLDLAAQRFIQDYQTEYGRPPGPYGVEAWDAARLLVAAVRDGDSDRAAVWDRLALTSELEGLGGPYVFERGELVDPASSVRVYRVRGGRWLEVASPSNA